MAYSSGLAAITVASAAAALSASGLTPQRTATSVGASVCSTSGRPLTASASASLTSSSATCRRRRCTSMGVTPPPPASKPGRAATKKALAAADVGRAGGAGGGGSGGAGSGGSGGAGRPTTTQAKTPSSWLQMFASADASVKEVIRPLNIGLKAGLVGALAVDVVHGIKPRLSFLETVEVTIIASLFAAAFVAALSFSDVIDAFQKVISKKDNVQNVQNVQNRVPTLCPATTVQISVRRGKRKVQQTAVDRVTLTHALQAAGSKGVEQVLWLVGNELKDNETVVAMTAEMEDYSYTIAGSTELALAAHSCTAISIELFRL